MFFIFIRNLLNKDYVRFVLVGGINTLFGYGLFSLLIYLSFHYTLAVALSTIMGVLFNFFTTGRLVFKNFDANKIFRFIFIYIVLYLINIGSLFILESFGYLNMYVNALVLIIPLSILSFILNKYYVFRSLNVN